MAVDFRSITSAGEVGQSDGDQVECLGIPQEGKGRDSQGSRVIPVSSGHLCTNRNRSTTIAVGRMAVNAIGSETGNLGRQNNNTRGQIGWLIERTGGSCCVRDIQGIVNGNRRIGPQEGHAGRKEDRMRFP